MPKQVVMKFGTFVKPLACFALALNCLATKPIEPPGGSQRILDDLSYPTMGLQSIHASGELPEPAVDAYLSTLAIEAQLHEQIQCHNLRQATKPVKQVHVSPQYIPGAPHRLYVYRDWISNAAQLETLKNLSRIQGDTAKASLHNGLHEIDAESM